MPVSFHISQSGDWERVEYSGPINEDAETHLVSLAKKLGPKCIINFRKVEFVNSCGVRAWVNFMRDLGKSRKVIFEECVPDIVTQINMIPSFRGGAEIKSVYASYACDHCGNHEQVLFEKGRNLPTKSNMEVPKMACRKCSEPMEMEELEDEFFAFAEAS